MDKDAPPVVRHLPTTRPTRMVQESGGEKKRGRGRGTHSDFGLQELAAADVVVPAVLEQDAAVEQNQQGKGGELHPDGNPGREGKERGEE